MKTLTVASALLGLAAFVAADSHLQTWSGPDCNSGDHLFWTAPPSNGPNTCKSVGNVKSTRVTDLGNGCTGRSMFFQCVADLNLIHVDSHHLYGQQLQQRCQGRPRRTMRSVQRTDQVFLRRLPLDIAHTHDCDGMIGRRRGIGDAGR